MVRHDMTQGPIRKKGRRGFTLIEILMTMVVLGILAGISIPTMKAYKLKAEYAVLQTTMRHIMDGEDLHFIKNNEFYPERGTVVIPKGVRKSISELGHTFPSGHNHRYMLCGLNRKLGRWRINYYYFFVYSDFDFNRNGRTDIFVVTTYIRNDELLYNRTIYQLR